MAVSDVEAVLEFLRKNGFSEAELALKADIVEKGDLRCSDYEKFLFPMVPPPPPIRIQANSRRSETPAGDNFPGSSPSASSDDEFVSVDSATSDICSSGNSNCWLFKKKKICWLYVYSSLEIKTSDYLLWVVLFKFIKIRTSEFWILGGCCGKRKRIEIGLVLLRVNKDVLISVWPIESFQ